ncbi:helix-turn-helix domain-containing protein [Mycolicibacter sinensis]
MATDDVERGPTGETVRQNLKRLRGKRGLSLRALAQLTEATDHPLGYGSINQIEQGRRRVDVDDLMTLAVVLNVPPPALLLPHLTGGERNDTVQATGLGEVNGGALWGWMKCMYQPTELGALSADVEEFGVTPDYRVVQGVWIIGIDDRAVADERYQLERRREQKVYELMDMYWLDYVEHRDSMND